MLNGQKKFFHLAIVIPLITIQFGYAQGVSDLELLDPRDAQVLKEATGLRQSNTLDLSELEEVDDLESLKSDIGEFFFEDEKPASTGVLQLRDDAQSERLPLPVIRDDYDSPTLNDLGTPRSARANAPSDAPLIFDVGQEEKRLLQLSRFVEGKIPENEWNEIAGRSELEKYVVQQGDWLWKISQKLFGSGFYYSKIWALNPHITNPHEIEPGMTLLFDSGSSTSLPNVQVGEFSEQQISDIGGPTTALDFREFGQDVSPAWLEERQKLINQGVYFQYASEETYEDLMAIGSGLLQTDYERYDPPVSDIVIQEPDETYDPSGFGRESVIRFNVPTNNFLNTFVTTNIVQDLGEIVATQKERVFVQQFDKVYIKLGNAVRVKPGDLFSAYAPGGKVSHRVSDRSGYRYSILAQLKIVRRINDLWEAEIVEVSGLIQRRDRLTVYTPRISNTIQTFNRRLIEAAIIGSYRDSPNSLSMGDIVYIDRGRADGVEMGNVFELVSFLDRGTGKRITLDPTYKTGEIAVITVTDNFATAMITQSSNEIPMGTIAITKTAEAAMLADQVRDRRSLEEVRLLESNALEELDVELNLDSLNRDLLMQADRIQLTEDELEELDRQEREKSGIQDKQQDLRELETLERELIEAENAFNEARVDEDKFLEQHDLDGVEGQTKAPDPNAFRSLDEIEREIGRRYLDEDLNARDNPFGLTEFDLEEIDELLNTGKQQAR
jgi:hypothetical protein